MIRAQRSRSKDLSTMDDKPARSEKDWKKHRTIVHVFDFQRDNTAVHSCYLYKSYGSLVDSSGRRPGVGVFREDQPQNEHDHRPISDRQNIETFK